MFWIVYTVLVVQRGIELMIAKRNEIMMKKRGGKEFAPGHYKFIVLLHIGFFISLFIESSVQGFAVSPLFTILFIMFILLQALRVWILTSLGRYWNTKIIMIKGERVIRKGPYKYLRHPNYVVVALEFMVIPAMFGAYVTMILFTLLNGYIIRFIRIPAEEMALTEQSDYGTTFRHTKRFFPKTFK